MKVQMLPTAALAAVAWLSGGAVNAADTKPPAHAQLECAKCHDGGLLRKFRRLQKQLGPVSEPGWDRVREEIPLDEAALQALSARCASCHAPQAKDWASSGHALTYARAFLNREHNRMEPPMDDCLRCHAMFFQGTTRDLVKPLDSRGPWQMVRQDLADHPSIPCLVCHQVHPERWIPRPSQTAGTAKLVGDLASNKAGFYDRRERRFFPARQLPQPKIFNDGNPLPVSADVRIRICYQCHAPTSPHQAGTSDDRTLRGVHEGMSCLDCHATHSLLTRQACAECHPAASNCGLDVTRMDTTARAKGSTHDIHTVACRDCHPQGTPKPTPTPGKAPRQ